MIAQLSHTTPLGRPGASIIGVRRAGFFARKSSVRVLPYTSSSVKSSLAARTNTRAVMLLTLGLMTCSLIADISFLLFAVDEFRRVAAPIGILGHPVRRQALGRSLDEAFDRVGQMNLGDRAVAALNAQPMRREQHVRAREAFGGVELPARQLDQEPERVLEIDGVEDHPVAHA